MAAVLTPGAARAQLPDPSLSTAEIAARAAPATATIVTLDARGDTVGQGSGFLLGPQGVLVTNWHVLRGAAEARVALASGAGHAHVLLLAADSLADVAILGLGRPEEHGLSSHDALPDIGEPVVSIGSPLGLPGTVTVGIVSATRVIDGVDVLQISAPLGPGSSGAPVLDGGGHVVAVATGFAEAAPHIGFATPVRYVLDLLAGPLVERTLSDVFGAARPSATDAGDRGAVDAGRRPQPDIRP